MAVRIESTHAAPRAGVAEPVRGGKVVRSEKNVLCALYHFAKPEQNRHSNNTVHDTFVEQAKEENRALGRVRPWKLTLHAETYHSLFFEHPRTGKLLLLNMETDPIERVFHYHEAGEGGTTRQSSAPYWGYLDLGWGSGYGLRKFRCVELS